LVFLKIHNQDHEGNLKPRKHCDYAYWSVVIKTMGYKRCRRFFRCLILQQSGVTKDDSNVKCPAAILPSAIQALRIPFLSSSETSHLAVFT